MDDWTFDFVAGAEDANNFHLRNDAGEDFRCVFVRSPNESSPLTMRINLAEVHHGKMTHEGDPWLASLLVFGMRFQSKLQERRYQSVEVTLEFFDKDGNNRRNPLVAAMAPDRMHWLDKTTYDRTTKYGASLDIKASAPVVSGGPSVHWEVEEKKKPNFKATVTGEPHSSRGSKLNGENAVTWSMQQNQDQNTGIPSFLQASVLLKRSHNAPFYAKLRVKSEVDIFSAARRSLPITTDRDKIIAPVTFRPGGEAQLKNTSATGIKEGDLLHMETLPINTYFKVNNSDEDPLNTATPATAPATNTEAEKEPPSAASPVAVHTTNIDAQKAPLIPAAPAIEQTTNRDVHTEPLNPPSPAPTTDRYVQSELLGPAAPATAPATKAMDRVVLVPDSPPKAAEVALKAVLKAAEAAKAASKAAQVAAEAAQEALEAVSEAAEAVTRAAEEQLKKSKYD